MPGRFSIDAIFSGQDNMSKIMARIERGAVGFGRGLQRDFGGLGKNFKAMTEGLGTIASAAGVAGVALGGLAAAGLYDVLKVTNEVADGQARLASVMTTTAGFAEGAADRIKEASLDWSKHHVMSARMFEDASYMMVSAGLNEAQALAGTRTALLVAAATFGNAAETAAALATQYNTLGDKTKDVNLEMAHLGDVMTKTQQTFQFKNLDQLNEGLKYGTPIAKMYGMNLETLSTVLGMLNNDGLTGSQAGTAFAASMMQMIPASKALGFALAKTKDGAFDFGGTLVNIHKKFGDFDKASDATKAALESAFGRRGIAAIALLSDKAGDFSKNLASISANAGAAASAAAIIEAAGSGPLDILMNKLTAVKVRLGDALSPVFGPMVDGIGKVVDSVGEWLHANQGLITGGLQSALTTVVPIVKELTSAFAEGFSAIMPAVKQFAGFMFSDFGSGAEWMIVLKRAAQILGGLTVAAIGTAAVFGGVLAAGFADAVTACDWLIGAWNSVIDGLGRVVFAVDNFFENIAAKWRAFSFADLANYLIDGLVNGIKGGAQRVADAVSGLGADALAALKSIWDSHSPAVKFSIEGGNAADGVALGITKGIPDAVRASQSMADQVLGAMSIGAPIGGMGAVTDTPAARMVQSSSSWLPPINAPTLGSDQSYDARIPAPVSGDTQPGVVSSRASDDDRLEQLLQRLLDRGSADGAVITVRAEKGSEADVAEQPKGGGKINVASSGAF